jgi:hypothetical protein
MQCDQGAVWFKKTCRPQQGDSNTAQAFSLARIASVAKARPQSSRFG